MKTPVGMLLVCDRQKSKMPGSIHANFDFIALIDQEQAEALRLLLVHRPTTSAATHFRKSVRDFGLSENLFATHPETALGYKELGDGFAEVSMKCQALYRLRSFGHLKHLSKNHGIWLCVPTDHLD